MSETKTTRKQLPAYLILALIALAAALLLAVTNAITAGPIKAHEDAAQNAAFQSVMEADSFSTMSIPDGCNVTSRVDAKKDGKTMALTARRGVILAAGGFESNQEMRERYLGERVVNPDALPALLFAGVLLEGGIIG